MNITQFSSLSDLKDFIDNAQGFVSYNCIGRQEVENSDDKTSLVTEIAIYSNLGILYHSSKNKYKTKTTMPPIAKKETELLDDKQELFDELAKKYKLFTIPVTIDKRTNNLDVGYTLKTKEKDVKRVTA